ncbi:MAG TPA: rhamnogalacturonan acetylesterase [Verrucomicrobiae bacterium]|nr:rhamnogalacturonan acetylesterase [Verrucomicrobiae bacterium]
MTKNAFSLLFIPAALAFAAALVLTGCAQTPPKTATATAAPVSDLAPDLKNNPPPRIHVDNPALPTIFIAGDSTAARGAGERQQGWAVPFANYFDLAKVNVVNCARGGRSSRTFITEGLWDRLLAEVKPGDIVLIQFGHNDAGLINDARRARGSLPGLGDGTREIDNLQTGKHEVVHTYGWYLRKMIADTQAKGATPIVLTLTVRDIWHNGRIERGSGRFSPWAAETAQAEHVLFIDLTDIMADQFEAMGEDKVKALYPRDHTHFNAVGADLHAAGVVAGLKGLRPSPITQFLSAKGRAVKADPFSWLQLPLPGNAKLPTLFLIGDSTVRNGRGTGANHQWGWGDFLGKYFDRDKINVVNRAIGGTSSRSYLTGGQWQCVLNMIKPGDFVMMQFGHNDPGPLNDRTRARGTIPGVGDASQAITNLLTGRPEIVHTYGWYLRKYIADTRAKGATPIVCSQIPRKVWKDGKIVRSKNSYAGWAEQVARAENAPFIDLNERIAERYDALGPEKVNPLFGDPHTHTTAAGAELNAQCVIAGLKALANDPLAPYLSDARP